MSRVPLPLELSDLICDRAVQIAREDLMTRGWRTSGALMPFAQEGQIGLRTTVRYLMYQNEGIRPFVMHWVEGRVIPLDCAQGDGPHIRTGKGAGTPGWVNIPHKGKTWRAQKWRHPGLKPKHFMQDALTRAVKENRKEIKQYLMRIISGEPMS